MYKIIECVKYFNMWSNFEIQTLFGVVEKYKKENKPLNLAFENYAIKTNRQTLSVRNFYYKMLKYYQNSPKKAKKDGINISLHYKKVAKKFTISEEKELVDKIEKLKKQGFSTRNACLKLSNNNPTLMLRYQNKYRYFLNSKIKTKEKQEDNKIIKINEYKKNRKLSDEDIKSLFLGLVKLIKTNALESVNENLKQENAENKIKLVNALNEINLKQNKIERLTKENNELFFKVKELDEKVNELRNKFLKLKIK